MNRRAFLTGAGLVAGVPCAAHDSPTSDVAWQGLWRIAWSGWRDAPAQQIRWGWWIATHPMRPERPYATTLGTLDIARDPYETLRSDVRHALAYDPSRHGPSSFDHAKQLALLQLRQALKERP